MKRLVFIFLLLGLLGGVSAFGQATHRFLPASFGLDAAKPTGTGACVPSFELYNATDTGIVYVCNTGGTNWLAITGVLPNQDCGFLGVNGFAQTFNPDGTIDCNFSSLLVQQDGVQSGGPEMALNFVTSTTVIPTVTDDPLNNRQNISLDLANTAVSPGSYTAANITIGADGRITAAANGGGAGGAAGNAGDVQLSDGAGGFLAVSGGNFNFNQTGNGLLSVGSEIDLGATAGVLLNIIGNGNSTTGTSLVGERIQYSGSATQTGGVTGIYLTGTANGAGSFKGIDIATNAENLDAIGIQIGSLSGTGAKIGLNIANVADAQYAIATGTGKVGIGGTFELGNCTSAGGTCTSTISGAVTIAAAATTVTVSTASVTAKSRIFITEDSSLGSDLSVTCNTTLGRTYAVTARTASTSFVITSSAAPSTNPACLSFFIVN